jgi:hypothetical protein
VRQEILGFGPAELAKLLFYVDDLGFDRPRTGYSLMSVLGARTDCTAVFAAIRDDPAYDDATRSRAEHLLGIEEHDPHYFRLWHKDGS